MKASATRMFNELTQNAQPTPQAGQEPDFTGWTRREIVDWRMARLDLEKAERQPVSATEPLPAREQFAAWDARDAAILAERAAKAAAERLAERPGSAAAQINASATRKASDMAARAAEESERLAEEAKRRPPPAENPEAPGSGAAPEQPKPKPKPQPQAHAPQPAPEAGPKQWWEERAHWRKRSRAEEEDARRGRPLYRCLVEYDPIARFRAEQEEEDYDPLE